LIGLGVLKREDKTMYEEGNSYIERTSFDWIRNLGGGIDFKINDKLIINAEYRHKRISKRNSSDYLLIGLARRF
jgi:opacity protein-like surface antigen